MSACVKQFDAVRRISSLQESLPHTQMSLFSGNTHKTAYPVRTDILGKTNRFSVYGCNHADVRAHAQPHHDDDDADEPDCFLIISRNCLIFLYNSL